MSRILYLVPLVGFTKEEKTRRERLANSFLTQEKNEVVVEDIEEGPVSIESSIEEYMCVGGMLKKLVAVQDNYDAAIIGCAGDPGLVPTKELVDIPIIGPLEASLHVASMLGETFTVIPSTFSTISRKLRDYGMEHRLASAEGIHFPVLEMAKNKEEVAKEFLKGTKRAVEQDNASSIIIGCMTTAFLLIDEMLKDKIDVPIINPAKISVKAAEMISSLGLKQSYISFPKPNYEKLKKTLFQNSFH